MRAVLSGQSLCSPLVAFCFYCYLIHTVRSSSDPSHRLQPASAGPVLLSASRAPSSPSSSPHQVGVGVKTPSTPSRDFPLPTLGSVAAASSVSTGGEQQEGPESVGSSVSSSRDELSRLRSIARTIARLNDEPRHETVMTLPVSTSNERNTQSASSREKATDKSSVMSVYAGNERNFQSASSRETSTDESSIMSVYAGDERNFQSASSREKTSYKPVVMSDYSSNERNLQFVSNSEKPTSGKLVVMSVYTSYEHSLQPVSTSANSRYQSTLMPASTGNGRDLQSTAMSVSASEKPEDTSAVAPGFTSNERNKLLPVASSVSVISDKAQPAVVVSASTGEKPRHRQQVSVAVTFSSERNLQSAAGSVHTRNELRFQPEAVAAAAGAVSPTTAATVNRNVPVIHPVTHNVPISLPVAHNVQVPQPVARNVPVPQPVAHNVPVPQPVAHNVPVPQPVAHNVPVPQPVIHNVPVPQPVAHNVPVSQPVAHNVPVPQPVAHNVPLSQPVSHNVPVPQPVAHNIPELQPFAHNAPVSQPVAHNIPELQPFAHNVPVSQPVAHNVQVPQPVAHNVVVPRPVAHNVPVPQPVSHNAPISQPVTHNVPVSQPVAHNVVVPQPVAHNAPVPQPIAHNAPVPHGVSQYPPDNHDAPVPSSLSLDKPISHPYHSVQAPRVSSIRPSGDDVDPKTLREVQPRSLEKGVPPGIIIIIAQGGHAERQQQQSGCCSPPTHHHHHKNHHHNYHNHQRPFLTDDTPSGLGSVNVLDDGDTNPLPLPAAVTPPPPPPPPPLTLPPPPPPSPSPSSFSPPATTTTTTTTRLRGASTRVSRSSGGKATATATATATGEGRGHHFLQASLDNFQLFEQQRRRAAAGHRQQQRRGFLPRPYYPESGSASAARVSLGRSHSLSAGKASASKIAYPGAEEPPPSPHRRERAAAYGNYDRDGKSGERRFTLRGVDVRTDYSDFVDAAGGSYVRSYHDDDDDTAGGSDVRSDHDDETAGGSDVRSYLDDDDTAGGSDVRSDHDDDDDDTAGRGDVRSNHNDVTAGGLEKDTGKLGAQGEALPAGYRGGRYRAASEPGGNHGRRPVVFWPSPIETSLAPPLPLSERTPPTDQPTEVQDLCRSGRCQFSVQQSPSPPTPTITTTTTSTPPLPLSPPQSARRRRRRRRQHERQQQHHRHQQQRRRLRHRPRPRLSSAQRSTSEAAAGSAAAALTGRRREDRGGARGRESAVNETNPNGGRGNSATQTHPPHRLQQLNRRRLTLSDPGRPGPRSGPGPRTKPGSGSGSRASGIRRGGGGGGGSGGGGAVYLSGNEALRLKPAALVSPGKTLPSSNFTVELWVKPEGGQYDPAVLLALSDTCGGVAPGGYWFLGVRTPQGSPDNPDDLGAASPTDARFFFTLKTARAARASTIMSHARYRPSAWTHLAASYDGRRMALYVNGALLAVGLDQSREVFPASSDPCMALTLGGVPRSAVALELRADGRPGVVIAPSTGCKFRGSVEQVSVWRRALAHPEVRRHVAAAMTRAASAATTTGDRNGDNLGRQRSFSRASSSSSSLEDRFPSTPGSPATTSSTTTRSARQDEDPGLYLHDDLDDLSRWWAEEDGRTARLVESDLGLLLRGHDLSLAVPLCGLTVCDNPDVVTGYVDNWQLRSAKQVRYRVVNLMNDDGSNPTVTDSQIIQQHDSLNGAFREYNISFVLRVHEVRNSTLRQRLIMFGCKRDSIGDGLCNPECMHAQTGWDGGDCEPEPMVCEARRKANGHCNLECNERYHDWDGGDCCQPGRNTHLTCYDPRSPYRAYVVIDELREQLGLRSDSHLNVFIAVGSDWKASPRLKAPHLIGLATFPWEKHVYSVQGGTVIQQETFGTAGQMDSLVHEVGHNLGLWHVHHGVSEMDCNDPCAETRPSMLLGDLCSDTAPTSFNVHCRDPGPTTDHCGVPATFTGTPFSNYMSYADDNCTNHFTEQQVARMHCYLDLVYQPWQTLQKPSPVPLPPKVVSADADSVTVAWVPPLGRDAHQLRSVCGQCDSQGALVQFAAFASSPAPSSSSSPSWSPQQATGVPDAEPCVPSTRAWLPDLSTCSKKTPCRLDLALDVPVRVRTLTLWVTWNADEIQKIRLVFDDGSASVLKVTPAYCDMPFTATLTDPRRLRKVQIYTNEPFTAIDAMQVVSTPNHTHCQACRPISYRVFRRPSMSTSYFRLTQETSFTDRDVERGVTYLYWVETLSRRSASQPSPVLTYTHGQHFCGDGHLDRNDGEECDDGNLVPDDGCDVTCHMEPSFHCKPGPPSVCYRHDGDGLCQDFERQSSVLDCGFYTPAPYVDHWAHRARANSRHQLPACPVRVATGPPPRTQRCGPIVDPRTAWFPCGSRFDTGNFWIELYVPRPVVATEVIVHVASDGRTAADPLPKELTVELLKEDNSTQLLTPAPLILDCRQPQLHVPVTHDLTTPFYRSRGVRLSFRSHNISIAAVRMRSYRHLDPVTLASCDQGELYNPHTGVCLANNCTRTPCGPARVEHAAVLCTGQSEGDVCVVKCQNGYRPQSWTMELSCRGGHWISREPAGCLPVDCGMPRLRGSVLVCLHGTTFGQNCSFLCRPPATLHGSDNSIVCEEDGLWSGPRASCLVTCPPPLHVQHVTRVKKQCRSGSLMVGSRCKMRCRKGYHVAGTRPATRRVFRVTCERDGTWSGSHCQIVTCPKFDPILTGLLSCTHGVTVSSRCTLTCPDNNETQLVTCGPDGQWNSSLRPCRHFSRLVCPYPHNATHLTLRCSTPTVGVQCPVSCPTPEDVAVYSGSHTYTSTGRQAQAGEVVNSVTCTGTGRWFPPLEHVVCIEQCNREYVGDSFCDARNNRKYCDWDGGDCCQSTLGSKVKPFPRTCGEACTCKDPKAAEVGGGRSANSGNGGGRGGGSGGGGRRRQSRKGGKKKTKKQRHKNGKRRRRTKKGGER